MKNDDQIVFRASYSILTAWKSGQWENAIAMYFKLDSFTNKAMEEGKKYHNEWEAETKETKCLPKVFGGKKLTNPQPERKIVKRIESWLDLVGVVDLVDGSDVYEYKTGVTSAAQYLNTQQGGIYALLVTLDNHFVDMMHLLHYNQHTNKTDVAVAHITDKMLRDALDFVKTYASEMHSYLLENNLYAELGDGKGGVKK